MTIEEATRILLQKIADRQKIVAPAIRHGIEKEIGSEFWLKRGQWEGLEMAYNIVHEWINDNADLLKEHKALKPIHDENGYYMCASCKGYVAFPNGDCKKSFCEQCGRPVLWEGC